MLVADTSQSVLGERRNSWLKAIRALEERGEFYRDQDQYELPAKREYIARRDVLERLKARDELGKRLIDATRLFAHSFASQQAINCGWSDPELFALDGGVVPRIVYERSRGFSIKEFTPENVKVQDNHSNMLTWRRPDCAGKPVWWQDPRIIAEISN
jgi:hypothetical protein